MQLTVFKMINELQAFLFYRNPNHHERPRFEDMLQHLSDDDSDLLKIPEGSLQSVKDAEKAKLLGAPLMYAKDLYEDLQYYYKSTEMYI